MIKAGWNIIRMLPWPRHHSRKCNPARLTNITHLTLNTNIVRNSKQCSFVCFSTFHFPAPFQIGFNLSAISMNGTTT